MDLDGFLYTNIRKDIHKACHCIPATIIKARMRQVFSMFIWAHFLWMPLPEPTLSYSLLFLAQFNTISYKAGCPYRPASPRPENILIAIPRLYPTPPYPLWSPPSSPQSERYWTIPREIVCSSHKRHYLEACLA